MEEIVLEHLERVRLEYWDISNKPEHHRKEHELENAKAVLLSVEALCMKLGLIEEWTI